jgi:ferritin-like protein
MNPEPSITGHAIRRRMGKIFKSLIASSAMNPEVATYSFRTWVRFDVSSGDREMVAKYVEETLKEIERRTRWIRQQLKENRVEIDHHGKEGREVSGRDFVRIDDGRRAG